MPAPWVTFDSVASYGGNCSAGAEPDIAGIGVIVSFIFASFMTTTASILAMLLDQAFDAKGRFTIRAPVRWVRERLIYTAWKRDYAWRPFLDPLIIGLGDQQLVTGFAVLLSGWIKVGQNSLEIQGAHFVLILYICALSSSSHLAALLTLRKYLCRHKLIARIRIALVMIFMASLLGSMIAAIAVPDHNDFFLPSNNTHANTDVETNTSTSAGGIEDPQMRVHRLSFIVPMTFMILGFSTALFTISYTPKTPPPPLLSHLSHLPRIFLSSSSPSSSSPHNHNHTRIHERFSKSAHYILTLLLVLFLNPLVAFIVQILLATLSAILVLSQKFSVPEDKGVWCGLSSGEEDQWGFGQTLSVGMLLLPAMGACQAYLEGRQEIG